MIKPKYIKFPGESSTVRFSSGWIGIAYFKSTLIRATGSYKGWIWRRDKQIFKITASTMIEWRTQANGKMFDLSVERIYLYMKRRTSERMLPFLELAVEIALMGNPAMLVDFLTNANEKVLHVWVKWLKAKLIQRRHDENDVYWLPANFVIASCKQLETIPMTNKKEMKPEHTVAGALVYADWLTDHDREPEANQWKEIALIQSEIARLITMNWECGLYGSYAISTLCTNDNTDQIAIPYFGEIAIKCREKTITIDVTAHQPIDPKFPLGPALLYKTIAVKHRKTFERGMDLTCREITVKLMTEVNEWRATLSAAN